ncbi:MAG: hypothetical protein H6843_10435 [Rhodospirillaceae bacterium]|nr:hypothetical protein [Rhodospirillaceae bacterium]
MRAIRAIAIAAAMLALWCGAPAIAGEVEMDIATAWHGTFTWDGETERQYYEVNILDVGAPDRDGWVDFYGVARNYTFGNTQPTHVDWEGFIDRAGRLEIYESLADPDADPADYDTDGYYVGEVSGDGCRITARWMNTAGGGDPVAEGSLVLHALDLRHCPPPAFAD